MNLPAEVLVRHAASLQRLGRRREAIDAYRQLLARRPDLADCWYNLGYLLRIEGDYAEALEAYGQCLARGIRSAQQVHLNRAVIYSDHLRRDEEAQRELEAALALDPAYAPALLNLGNLHEEHGDRASALSCYDRILSASPAGTESAKYLRFEALARSVQLRAPSNAGDPLMRELQQAATGPTVRDAAIRANLWFALGRAHDRIGAYDDAFRAFVEANRHARVTGAAYDRLRSERLTDLLMVADARLEAAEVTADDGFQPLFICGMFRSGSTLLEQVLAAHPRVTAGGELDLLRHMAGGVLAPFPASLQDLTSGRAASLAREYRSRIVHLFPHVQSDCAYVTDKRPDNFQLIGLIRRLFPSTRIIHTIRNPLDNCLSIFMNHLDPRVLDYSSDLADIGHYYGQYRHLMAHWKQVLGGSIFDFDYDHFVREPRVVLARLLDYLGLEWDDRCLEFHTQANAVKTASYWQVRRPLYDDACGRWRHYEAHLGSLRRALYEGGVAEVG